MPIYEYHCAACGGEFEQLVRGDTRVACPTCDSAKVERLISMPARPAGKGNRPIDYSRLGPPKGTGGGCGGGGCGCH